MAMTLTIELSDELEKQVIVQAKQRLVSPEKIVLQCLSQTLTGNQTQRERPQSTELSSIKWVWSQTVEFYILNSQGLPAIVRQAAQRATPRLINRYSAGNNYF